MVACGAPTLGPRPGRGAPHFPHPKRVTATVPPAVDPRHSAGENATREWTGTFAVLDEALRQDQAELQREVLLWHRWIRYAAAVALIGIGLLVRAESVRDARGALLAAALGAAYVTLVWASAWMLARERGQPLAPAWPALAFGVDVVALVGGAWLMLTPAAMVLLLLAGFLLLQMSVFSFGRWYGVATGSAILASYVLLALVLPPYVPGPRPGFRTVVATAGAFAFVGGVLVITLGGYRARMNALRRFCKRVEMGDLSSSYDTDRERRPDDLTLLARSVDAMRQRLIELVGTDPLTGALNRRALELRLRREWRGAKRRGSALAVLAVDLDNFKPINDTHGHAAGDTVLRELADVMRMTVRDTDVIARVGGDEFVLLLPDTGWQGAITLAERLRRHVDEQTFAGEQRIPLTVSIGIALARGADDVRATDLLEEADRSLYRAKTSGRNRIGA
jgi:diguanylate cyclase (GGDEF)-like protein